MSSAERGLSRRELLTRGALLVGGLAIGGQAGRLFGSGEERGKHLSPGELPPELRDKLKTAGLFIYKPEGETIAYMRATDLDISPSPLVIPEGQPDFEQATSKRKWIAKPIEFIIPGKGDEDVKGLGRLVTSKQSGMQTQFGKDVVLVPGEAVDLLGLDLALRLNGKQGIFNGEGFVLTGTKIKINGIDNVVAIGRRAPGEPISYSFVDVSTQNPIPPTDKIVAAGIVVAK